MRAAVGCTVHITDLADVRSERFTLVEPEHASPQHGKLSVRSPVGAALVGLTAGQTADVPTPTGTRTYRLDRVHAADGDDLAPAPRPPAAPARRRRANRQHAKNS